MGNHPSGPKDKKKQRDRLGKRASSKGDGLQRITSTNFLYYHLGNEPITNYYTLGKKLGQPGIY